MKIKHLLPALAMVLAINTAHAAQSIPVAGTVHDPAQMPAGLYTLDPSHAHAMFYINHMGFSEYVGGFNDISGQLIFRPDALENSKLKVTIKTDSIAVNSAELIHRLKSPDFFDAAQFPDITFVSESLTHVSADQGILTGKLTMHGITQPVALKVTFEGGGKNMMTQAQTMGFVATGNLKRSDFGMTNFLPGLGDDVRLDISAEFGRVETAPPAQRKP